MKVIYFTDIHDALKEFRFVLKHTEADLYIASGDLVYRAFYSDRKLYEYVELQDKLHAYAKRYHSKHTSQEMSDDILRAPFDFPAEMHREAEQYRADTQKAGLNMYAKYSAMRSSIVQYAAAPVMMIPGNYDMDLENTGLFEFDLHKKIKTVQGISFAGFGGAPVFTPGIPENISVVFNEKNINGKIISEPRDFFMRARPDVMVVHNPAYGTLDKTPGRGNCGSQGLREYLDTFAPRLALSGHIHEDYGLMKINGTLCLNPSNFGSVDSLYGYQAGGYFASIELQKTADDRISVETVTLHRLCSKHSAGDPMPHLEVRDIARVDIDDALRCHETVLDSEEFAALGHFLL